MNLDSISFIGKLFTCIGDKMHTCMCSLWFVPVMFVNIKRRRN